MKIQAAIITIAIVIMVILSVIAFTTFSFATRITTNSSSSSSSSTGAQRTTTVTSTTGTVDVSLKSQRPLPSAGIPVIVTYSGAAAGQPTPSHFNAKEQPTAVQIPTSHNNKPENHSSSIVSILCC
jgi:hypothetical protein